jgi:hypothetical protein
MHSDLRVCEKLSRLLLPVERQTRLEIPDDDVRRLLSRQDRFRDLGREYRAVKYLPHIAALETGVSG